jgi:hypothetical protein
MGSVDETHTFAQYPQLYDIFALVSSDFHNMHGGLINPSASGDGGLLREEETVNCYERKRSAIWS